MLALPALWYGSLSMLLAVNALRGDSPAPTRRQLDPATAVGGRELGHGAEPSPAVA